jgi:hypothetical protein
VNKILQIPVPPQAPYGDATPIGITPAAQPSGLDATMVYLHVVSPLRWLPPAQWLNLAACAHRAGTTKYEGDGVYCNSCGTKLIDLSGR